MNNFNIKEKIMAVKDEESKGYVSQAGSRPGGVEALIKWLEARKSSSSSSAAAAVV